MYNFRYYAIGHSYLKHGPFVGWQTDGFWGMAASAPEKDYFHKFQDELKAAFDCKIEAIAENQAAFEGLCTEDATEEKYVSSPLYSHMRELIEGFKPNIITVYIGGGNTPAKDGASLTLFYDVLYGLIASCKRPETVVICPALKPNIYGIAKPVADKYGFITVDMSFIHEKKGSKIRTTLSANIPNTMSFVQRELWNSAHTPTIRGTPPSPRLSCAVRNRRSQKFPRVNSARSISTINI